MISLDLMKSSKVRIAGDRSKYRLEIMQLLRLLANMVQPTTIVIFYTEILTGKVVLWCFFSSETSEKMHNSTFQVKISVKNVIFSNEMTKKPRYYTYFSTEFGKIPLKEYNPCSFKKKIRTVVKSEF